MEHEPSLSEILDRWAQRPDGWINDPDYAPVEWGVWRKEYADHGGEG